MSIVNSCFEDQDLDYEYDVVCGHQGAIHEETWGRQLGAWLSLPGVSEGSNLSLLSNFARHITERLARSK